MPSPPEPELPSPRESPLPAPARFAPEPTIGALDGCLAFGLAIGGAILLSIVLVIPAILRHQLPDLTDPWFILAAFIATEMALTCAIFAPLWWRGARVRRALAWYPTGLRNLLLAALGTIAVSLLADKLGVWVHSHMPWWPSANEMIGDVIGRAKGVSFVLIVLAVSLIAPVMEEAFFRGLLQGGFSRRCGWFGGALLAAVLFGLIHADPVQTPAGIVLGLYLGLARWRSGSLFPAVAGHIANNTLASVVFLAKAQEGTAPPWLLPAAGLFALVTLLLMRRGPEPAAPTIFRSDAVPRFPLALDPLARQRLLEALAPRHQQYDAAVHMVQTPFHSPGYHTTLTGGTVHPTRESLVYAVAVLDTGELPLLPRGIDIVRKVVSLQDRDPAHDTCGIWSWFLEEPLQRMSPPDWNWADFCGVQLLQVVLSHRDRLPAELAEQVDEAVRCAAASIRKRNVGPAYTHIAVMGTYVTLVAAETYGDEELLEYALDRLRRLHAHCTEQGAFTEYNSPTYTVVALQELARLYCHAEHPEALALTEDLYRMAWQEIADHFHSPTRQWSGPHSRCYSTLLDPRTLAFIERSLDGRVDWGQAAAHPGLEEQRLPTPCPDDLIERFVALEPRELRKTFVGGERPVVGTTWLTPELSLGSINRGILWNQARPLLAYWGTPEAPAFLRLRFLHDGYDFCAARFEGEQREGLVLAGITFDPRGGDRHPSLDRLVDGAFTATDLRLRFELGGAARELEPALPGTLAAPLSLDLGGLTLHLTVPFARFGELSGRWAIERDEATVGLDVVLYQGEARRFELVELGVAAVGLAVQFGGEPPAVAAELAGGRLELSCGGLAVEAEL